MVYNSSQSALYKAIDRYNGSDFNDDFRSEKCIEKNSDKPCPKSICEDAEKNARRETKKRCESAENSVRCEKKIRCENCTKNRAYRKPSDPISKIMSDKDMLLIAGLIFILMKENADKSLILALAIVLLG